VSVSLLCCIIVNGELRNKSEAASVQGARVQRAYCMSESMIILLRGYHAAHHYKDAAAYLSLFLSPQGATQWQEQRLHPPCQLIPSSLERMDRKRTEKPYLAPGLHDSFPGTNPRTISLRSLALALW
jgi:hypothetical protein